MSLFKPKHDWGDIIPTLPAVRPCKRCGIHVQAGAGDIDLLPRDMKFAITYRDCQKSEYTQHQMDVASTDSYKQGWLAGQNSGLGLQPDFTQKFFEKIRLNPNTQVYEIPVEAYLVLKDKLATDPVNPEGL